MQKPASAENASPSSSRINPTVFYGSIIGILGFLAFAMLFTEQADKWIGSALVWTIDTFGWFYMLAIVAYLVFGVLIACSRFGRIRLGPDDSRPEFSLMSWAAMLFAAGIGIDILFYCIAEPLSHYVAPVTGDPMTQVAIRNAMVETFFHWGLSGWGIYVLAGMSLAYFSYRHRLPLAIRSAFYPLLGNRINGPIGNAVDIFAIISTVFGIATSLGIGVIQLNYGLKFMLGIPENIAVQAALIVGVMVLATISVVTGVEKGIRLLSEFNMLLATALLIFVLAVSDTSQLLNALVLNIGDYFTQFVSKSFDTYAYTPDTDEWMSSWTLFFWGWWIAWTPFVGLFLARISRGRTIRQFVFGALLIPLSFMMVWMSVFGNASIDMVANQGVTSLATEALNAPQNTIYTFLEQLPLSGITTAVVAILGIVFFVTSADSGALVLANFTSILKDVNHDAPIWLRIFWSAIIGLLTLALLMVGGLGALQSAVVITAVPFSIVLIFMMIGMYKALMIEDRKENVRQDNSCVYEGVDWHERLDHVLDFAQSGSAEATLKRSVRPALNQLAEELTRRGQVSTVTEEQSDDEPLPRVMLEVEFEDASNFVYQVRSIRQQTPSFIDANDDYYLRLAVHLSEGGSGQELNGLSRAQVLDEVVTAYQQHLAFVRHDTVNEAPVMPGVIGKQS
ncbi:MULTISPECIES: choline BCCT transporter BetT [Cobetia]|uniref:BCCT family transporter n=1 Tax=Cobetia crustatorum TaxID=553385 RepID=A0A558HFA6_9GAMM|nr:MULTISPECIES: choline BCCT transporter BetT [Cobetia]TVU67822.1 BCCT family transporter [Cobetia crustatorum]